MVKNLHELSQKVHELGEFKFDTIYKDWIGSIPASDIEIEKNEKRGGVKLLKITKLFFKLRMDFLQ